MIIIMIIIIITIFIIREQNVSMC